MEMLPEPLDRIDARSLKHVELPKGTELFHVGQKSTGFYYLIEGSLSLLRYSSEGEETVLHRVKPGETFAEASLFSKEYHCVAYSTKNSRLLKIERKEIFSLIEEEPEFSILMLARFASQVQNYRQRIELLSINEASKRVYVAIQNNMLTGSIIEFAADINLSHEAVYRALKELVNKNKLEKLARGSYRLL